MTPSTKGYTFEDLLELDVPDDGRIYEIIGGELVANAAPNANHREVVVELFGLLYSAMRAGFGRGYTAPSTVLLDYAGARENAPQPDLWFVRQERLSILDHAQYVEGAPDLVIEVRSPNDAIREIVNKYAMYERFAVPHLWYVDPDSRIIYQFELVDGTYREPVQRGIGDTLSSSLFPGITLEVAAVFERVREVGRRLPRLPWDRGR